MRARKNESHTRSTPLQGSFGAPLRKNPTWGALATRRFSARELKRSQAHQNARADAQAQARARRELAQSRALQCYCIKHSCFTKAQRIASASPKHARAGATARRHGGTKGFAGTGLQARRSLLLCFRPGTSGLLDARTHTPLLDSPLTSLTHPSLSPSYQSTGDSPQLAHTPHDPYLLSCPRTYALTNSPSSQ